jgi:DNA-binding HxlR family transcriptional regulator
MLAREVRLTCAWSQQILRRRDGDGCPIAGALQLIGDKWTMLVVRDLSTGPKRTTELLAGLHPISSRTLVDRLKDMEHDLLIERKHFGGSPPRVEYVLTERGLKLLPMLDALRTIGEALDCNTCDDRVRNLGAHCESCPRGPVPDNGHRASKPKAYGTGRDDSIVLL